MDRPNDDVTKSGTCRWDTLTRAERQVVALTAEGFTNREIGERLFVSRRTVQSHLSHVFTKLGISSRVTLAVAVAHTQRG
jgi:DNA-binding CsgD family transcriptional regulator